MLLKNIWIPTEYIFICGVYLLKTSKFRECQQISKGGNQPWLVVIRIGNIELGRFATQLRENKKCGTCVGLTFEFFWGIVIVWGIIIMPHIGVDTRSWSKLWFVKKKTRHNLSAPCWTLSVEDYSSGSKGPLLSILAEWKLSSALVNQIDAAF